MQEASGGIGSWRLHDAKKFVKHCQKKRMLEDRGALPTEEGNVIREYKAIHEENFSAVG